MPVGNYYYNINSDGLYPSRKDLKEIFLKIENQRIDTYLGGDMDKFNKICTDEVNQTIIDFNQECILPAKNTTVSQNSSNLYTIPQQAYITTTTYTSTTSPHPSLNSSPHCTPIKSPDKYEILNRRLNVEQEEDWRSKIGTIPSISFPSSWNVKIIPPYGGLLVRFIVTIPEHDKVEVSVYYDHDNRMGYFRDENDNPAPYWEIYPYEYSCISGEIHGETYRVIGSDTKQLVERIKTAIHNQIEHYRSLDIIDGRI